MTTLRFRRGQFSRPGRPGLVGLAGHARGWLALACSVGVYLLISHLTHQPFHLGGRALKFFDLRVYRVAAHRMLYASPTLYAHPILKGFGFTYPPAAALLLTPLALIPLHADKIVVTWLNLALLLWLVHCTLKLAGLRREGRWGGARLWSLVALLSAYAIWLEPVSVTLGYGQIDLLIAGLVVYDLALEDSAPHKGLGVGIAAGIKLTPLTFIVYLALAGQSRVALRALLTFVVTIAISFAVSTHDTIRYWGSLVFDSSRVGGAGDPANQSLRGALSRLSGNPHPGAGLELIVVLVAVIGIALAVRAGRRGELGLGFSLCAVTTLLASPVSWTHHWCLAVPGLILLGVAARRRRSRWLGLATLISAAVGFAYLPELYLNSGDTFVSGVSSLGSDAYVLFGLAVLAVAAADEGRQWLRRRSAPSPSPALPVPR